MGIPCPATTHKHCCITGHGRGMQSRKATQALEGHVANRTMAADCDPTTYSPKRKFLFPALKKGQESRSHQSIYYARN